MKKIILNGIHSIEIVSSRSNLHWEWVVRDLDYGARNPISFKINKVYRRLIDRNPMDWSRTNEYQNRSMFEGSGDFEMDFTNLMDIGDPRVFYEFNWEGIGIVDYDISITPLP